MAVIGYERVSRLVQHPEAQTARLRGYGCTMVYTDYGVSGAKASRPQWDRCLDHLRQGDTLVAVRLDRLGRSLKNLIEVVQQLAERGVDLVVLDQQIDTTTASGRLLFHMIAAIAEFERDLLRERVADGLAAARERHGGTLPVRGPSIDPGKLEVARELYARGELPRRGSPRSSASAARRCTGRCHLTKTAPVRPPGPPQMSGRKAKQRRKQAAAAPRGARPGPGAPGALPPLSDEAKALLRQEIDQVRAELGDGLGSLLLGMMVSHRMTLVSADLPDFRESAATVLPPLLAGESEDRARRAVAWLMATADQAIPRAPYPAGKGTARLNARS